MIKKIAYVDRSWGHCDDHSIGGDMGFSFNDATDTRTENFSELFESCSNYALGQDALDCGDTYDPDEKTFAIYEIIRTDIELDEEDDPLWSGTDVGEKEIVALFVCAPRDVAGWIEDKDYYKNSIIYYRNDN